MTPDVYAKHLPVVSNGHDINPRSMTALVTKLPGEEPHVYGEQYDCGVCGHVLVYRLDGETVQAGTRYPGATPCQFPEGITSKNQLVVYSGKIIVTDDLRPVYDGFDDSFASYNTAYGQHQVIEAYAEQGCAYGPVGNSCPALYRTGDDTYVIANGAYDEDTDATIVPVSWEKLAWVCTDLWAYSIADHEDWADRCGDDLEHYRGRLGHYEIVDVPPGTYQFTHHTGEKNFDHDSEGVVVFADIRRLGND